MNKKLVIGLITVVIVIGALLLFYSSTGYRLSVIQKDLTEYHSEGDRSSVIQKDITGHYSEGDKKLEVFQIIPVEPKAKMKDSIGTLCEELHLSECEDIDFVSAKFENMEKCRIFTILKTEGRWITIDVSGTILNDSYCN